MDDYLLAIRLLWYAPAQGATTRQRGSSTHHPPATPPFDCPAWPCFSSSTNLRKSQPRPRGPAARSSLLPGSPARHWEFRNIPTDLASVRRTLKGILEPSIHQLSGTRLRPRDTVNSCHSQPHRTTVHARFLYRKRDRNLEDTPCVLLAHRVGRRLRTVHGARRPWRLSPAVWGLATCTWVVRSLPCKSNLMTVAPTAVQPRAVDPPDLEVVPAPGVSED